MTGKEFLNGVSRSKEDIVHTLLALLNEVNAGYCVIGGLAVNAYAEPVVSLDLDLVVVADKLDVLRSAAAARGMTVEAFPHSVNLSTKTSDLRLQLQTDSRYQGFIVGAETHDVLGYRMSVASVEDVLQGKLWAYSDNSRRPSKRQKDLADILRLVENHPELQVLLPLDIARIAKEG